MINTTTSYHYTVLDLNLAALEFPLAYDAYIQIDVDSSYLTTFMSAYLNSYNPLNLAANYLGDAGSSGNYFGSDTIYVSVFCSLRRQPGTGAERDGDQRRRGLTSRGDG